MSWSFLFSPTESAESFTIPSLWRCCLRVQCPVVNPVSYLKFSLQWLLRTLDLPQSKSPSSLVFPSPPVSFQICTVSPKTLNQSSAGSFIFLPLPLCLLLKRTLSIWGKLGISCNERLQSRRNHPTKMYTTPTNSLSRTFEQEVGQANRHPVHSSLTSTVVLYKWMYFKIAAVLVLKW